MVHKYDAVIVGAGGASDGVWRCRAIFNCLEACPRGIDITRAIGEVKKALLYCKI
jgi:succinate dehydrogenase/fumarate reductase-like Fe-S protein